MANSFDLLLARIERSRTEESIIVTERGGDVHERCLGRSFRDHWRRPLFPPEARLRGVDRGRRAGDHPRRLTRSRTGAGLIYSVPLYEQRASRHVVDLMGRSCTNLGPTRAELINMGLPHPPQHGYAAFTVPHFDRLLIRAIPTLEVAHSRSAFVEAGFAPRARGRGWTPTVTFPSVYGSTGSRWTRPASRRARWL